MKAAHTKARKSYDRQAATVAALTLPAGTANSVLTAAVTALTVPAGTADSTIAAVPDPTDTPATADALRDDLVTNVIPVINADILDLGAKINALQTELNANILDLGAKVNEIRTALRTAGLML
jgi:hypothetical protein